MPGVDDLRNLRRWRIGAWEAKRLGGVVDHVAIKAIAANASLDGLSLWVVVHFFLVYGSRTGPEGYPTPGT